jgi:replicative DNA helicase
MSVASYSINYNGTSQPVNTLSLSKQEDFSRFGKSFQEGLCRLILLDRPFADQIGEVLDVNFFELKYLQVFCKKIYDYKEKYKTHPTPEIMTSILRSELGADDSDPLTKQVRSYFARILAKSGHDAADYIKETSLDFCKKQKLKEAILKSVKLIQSSSFDEVKGVIDQALKLGADSNFGHDYLKDFEARFVPRFRYPVSTGWKQMDNISGGGLGKGELGVVIAPTGAGKSMVLAHLGAQAIKSGKCVVHYTLELQDTVTANRYDSCITGIEIKNLLKHKEEVLDAINDIEGRLIVKEYPTKTATTQTIMNHLEKLVCRGIDVGMVIVDYADLLRPVRQRNEKRTELESIYEELRAVAQTYECPVWTASQTNRSGLNAEVVTMESISEAFSKCFVADFIFSLSRTVEDKNTNTGRVYIAKNRNGPDGLVFPIFMDPASVKINVLERDDETQQAAYKNKKDALEDLKEKYKKFRKKGKEDDQPN